MDVREELKSAGVYPTGPVSAWPQERNEWLYEHATPSNVKHATKVKASPGRMAKGLAQAAGSVMRHGKVSSEVREERYNTCKGCPAFIEGSKRCGECGCFMEAKTWVGGNPDTLCPLKKWER
jgi:hypothetical protein